LVDTVGSVVSSVGSFFGFGDDEEEEEPVPKVGDAVEKSMPVATARAETISEARPVIDAEAERLVQVGAAVKQNASSPSYDSEIVRQALPVELLSNQSQQSISNKYEINIQTAPGQSAEEIAEAVMQRIEESGRDNARLAMYDG